ALVTSAAAGAAARINSSCRPSEHRRNLVGNLRSSRPESSHCSRSRCNRGRGTAGTTVALARVVCRRTWLEEILTAPGAEWRREVRVGTTAAANGRHRQWRGETKREVG